MRTELHWSACAYPVDVESLGHLQQRMALREGIARGEMATVEGRILTYDEVKERMGRWLK
jgi:hypothetical protein